MEKREIVVVGGGPAGSTIASLLAKAGVDVLVLEREQFPRFHIGESMLPQSMKIWQRLGVVDQLEEAFMPKYGARFLCCRTGRTNSFVFTDAFDQSVTHAFQVPRADFDALLLRHSATLGAEVRHGWRVTGPLLEATSGAIIGVKAKSENGEEREIGATLVVDATGRDAMMIGKRAEKSRLPGLDKTAFFTHWEGVERQDGKNVGDIDIIMFPEGWFWNIPFKGTVNSFGFVCSSQWIKTRGAEETLDAFYDRTVAGASWAARLLKNAKRLAPVRALADYSYRVDRYSGAGWVAVGDVTGFIDPLFSTGAHLAFSSSAFAADEIIRARNASEQPQWEEYERRVRRGSEVFMGAVQSFYEGTLSRMIFDGPQRKIMKRIVTSMLAGDVFDEDAMWLSFLTDHFPAHPDDRMRVDTGQVN